MKRNITRSFCLILLLLTVSLCLQAQTLTYYVSANSGNDANNGTTTTTSFKTLQKAITAMNSNPAALEIDILVEGGVYKPTDGTGDATTRTVSFNFFRNFYPFLTNAGGKKLKIQGGYNFSTGVRDFVHNPSYLDGDIGEAGNAADNSYHVVIIGSTNSTKDSTVVDGFQILHGNADGGGGLVPITPYFSVPSGEGGGIELQGNNNPRIAFQNCVVRDNLALKGGGVVSFFSAG